MIYFAEMLQFEKTYQGWTWERISRHVFYWSAWLLFYAVANSTYNEGVSFLDWIYLELVVMCVKLPFTYFVIYYLVPQYLLPKKYLTFLTTFTIAAIIGGIAIWALFHYIFNPLYFDFTSGAFWTGKIAYKIVDLVYVTCIPVILKMYQRQAAHEKRATQLVEQKLGAELKLLKNQLHPHFLFNTLNNLYSMVLTKHDQASDVVVRLSNMMSYMLYECEKETIGLEKEIDNLKNYIELEKIRYGKRLDVSFESGGEVNGKTIAPLLLLPFLENAFKHGVEKSEETSWVRINLWEKANELTFLIENSVPEPATQDSLPKTQSGIGLPNVRKRLELLYPNNYQLELIQEDSFMIKLNINLQR